MEFGSDTCYDPPCQTPSIYITEWYIKIAVKVWATTKQTNKGRLWTYSCHNWERERERYPTRMPSSISVGETLSPSPTTNCNAKRENKIRMGGQLPTAVRQTIAPPHTKTSFSSSNSVPWKDSHNELSIYYLCNLLNIDHIFWVISTWIYNLGTPCNLHYNVGKQIRNNKPEKSLLIKWSWRLLQEDFTRQNMMHNSNSK
jgi:hypothetical protein